MLENKDIRMLVFALFNVTAIVVVYLLSRPDWTAITISIGACVLSWPVQLIIESKYFPITSKAIEE
jgi:uncharacterized integral membrane protein